MNIQKLNAAMDNLKSRTGDALVVTSILGYEDGQTLMEVNSDPKTDALIARMTSFLVQVMSKSTLGKIGDYVIIDYSHNIVGVILLFERHCWAIGIDKTKLPLGMLLNIILPDTIKDFNGAL